MLKQQINRSKLGRAIIRNIFGIIGITLVNFINLRETTIFNFNTWFTLILNSFFNILC